MIKRLTWFVGGAVAGAAGTSYAKRKVKAAAAQLAPTNIARTAADRARQRAHDLTEAVREGRAAMRSTERELRARRDGDVVDTVAVETDGYDDALHDDPPDGGRVLELDEARSTPRDGRRRGSRSLRRGA